MHAHHLQPFNTILLDGVLRGSSRNAMLKFDDDQHTWECAIFFNINESKAHIENAHSLRSTVLSNTMQELLQTYHLTII